MKYLITLLLLISSLNLTAQTDISISVSEELQIMQDWEATSFASQDNPYFNQFKDELFRKTIIDLGINRIRLELRSGIENSKPYWSMYRKGEITYQEWRNLRYATENDNDDPDSINWNYFYFDDLDDKVERIILPLKNIADSIGAQLRINLNYVAFTSQIVGSYHHSDLDEYAEFVLAALIHLKTKYDLDIDFVEVILEPDNVSQWRSGKTIADAIVKTAAKLKKNGIQIKGFIGPSNTNMTAASWYINEIVKNPEAVKNIEELCYHRYGGVTAASLKAIADTAKKYNLKTSMLEHIGSGYADLFDDILNGNNSSWAQYTIAGIGPNDDGGCYFRIDTTQKPPVVRFGSRTRLLKPVFSNVNRGDIRIKAYSYDSASVRPMAFKDQNGIITLIAEVKKPQEIFINNLPDGIYQYTLTPFANSPDEVDTVVSEDILKFLVSKPGLIVVKKLQEVSINSGIEFQINLYPQPAFDYVIIPNPDKQIRNIKIIDDLGIIKLSIETAEERVDVSSLPRGAYLLSITTKVQILTRKLIIM